MAMRTAMPMGNNLSLLGTAAAPISRPIRGGLRTPS